MTDALHSLIWAVFPALLLLGAFNDVTSFTIPNWISLTLAGLFAPLALIAGVPAGVIGLSYLIGLAVLLMGMGMFAMNWIGGGDAKLLAAAVIWIGWPQVMTFVLATALAGGALAVLLAAARASALQAYAARGPGWVTQLMAPGGAAPYGVAIAVGGLVAFPSAPIVTAALQAG